MKHRMKTLSGLFLILLLVPACDKHKTASKSAEQSMNKNESSSGIQPVTVTADQFPDLKQIEHPTVDKIVVGKAYIETIRKVKFKGNQALLIKGNLPDGCSKLYQAKAIIDDSTLVMDIKTWKPQHLMCTQALVPFSFIYQGLSLFEFNSISHYKAGNNLKKF